MTTLEQLQARWPGLIAVAPAEALTPLDVSCSEYAAYQRRRRGTYPFPVVKIGGCARVRLTDIAKVIDGLPQGTPPPAAAPVSGRRPGRPRGAARAAARHVGTAGEGWR